MQIVLDTNVLVSAILTPGGPAHRIIQIVLRGDLELCVDGRIVEEYKEVLTRRKFGLSRRETGLFLGSILETAQQVLATPVSEKLGIAIKNPREFLTWWAKQSE